jgi:hypothetical protein
VTGIAPFAGGSDALLWARIDRVSYTAPSAAITAPSEDAGLMRQIDRLVASCLTRDAARRPTAEALAAAAADALAGAERISANAKALKPAAPPGAAPVSAPMALVQDWLERRWLLITSVCAAVVLFGLAIFLALDTPPRRPGPGTGVTAVGGRPAAEKGVHHIDVVSGRARVSVNGRPLGDTPVDYVGPIGETVSVELRQEGFVPTREDIQITTTGTSTFTMRRATREQP